MTRRIVGLGLAVLVALGAAVAAFDRSRDDSGADTDAFAPLSAGVPGIAPSAAAMATGGGGGVAKDEAGVTEASGQDGQVGPAGPRIVKRASLRLTVDAGADGLRRAFDRAASVADTVGGFVASSASTDGEATLTLRVPADRFDEARTKLSALGEVEGEELSGNDVTAQLVDFDARLRSLAAQEDALRTLLGRANAVGEILEVQARLFDVRQQVEQLAAQRAQLADAAELATIAVSFTAPGVARSDTSESPFERAWDGALDVAGGMVIVVGYALPFAVLALVLWLALRLRRVRPHGAAPAEQF